ncbi:hypothetical protein T492DRAFT_836735 [Pavlovales sp. CCMP2436]|nr:hypothetical protein T492DRAFT_836735 [Pavlovales sp. CCMP2436]
MPCRAWTCPGELRTPNNRAAEGGVGGEDQLGAEHKCNSASHVHSSLNDRTHTGSVDKLGGGGDEQLGAEHKCVLVTLRTAPAPGSSFNGLNFTPLPPPPPTPTRASALGSGMSADDIGTGRRSIPQISQNRTSAKSSGSQTPELLHTPDLAALVAEAGNVVRMGGLELAHALASALAAGEHQRFASPPLLRRLPEIQSRVREGPAPPWVLWTF